MLVLNVAKVSNNEICRNVERRCEKCVCYNRYGMLIWDRLHYCQLQWLSKRINVTTPPSVIWTYPKTLQMPCSLCLFLCLLSTELYVIWAMMKANKICNCTANTLFLFPYHTQLFGDVCYHCNRVIEGDGEKANFNKSIKAVLQPCFCQYSWRQFLLCTSPLYYIHLNLISSHVFSPENYL